MYDNKRGKWLENPGKESETVSNYPEMNQGELVDDVAMALQKIYLELGTGLPDCVYQLKLHNDLTKKGFQLQAEEAMLNNCVKDIPDRSRTLINETLVIKYVTTNRATDYHKKMMTYDLERNSYGSALMINLNDGNKKISMIEVKKANTYH